MSKIKLLIAGVIGLLMLNVGLIGFLFLKRPMPGRQGREMGPVHDAPKQLIVKRLHFSPSQTHQYEVLIKKHQIKVRGLNDSIATIKNELYGSLANENFEAKDVLIARLADLQKQIELTHYDHFAAIRKICEADQIADFNALSKDLSKLFFRPKIIGQDGPPPGE